MTAVSFFIYKLSSLSLSVCACVFGGGDNKKCIYNDDFDIIRVRVAPTVHESLEVKEYIVKKD